RRSRGRLDRDVVRRPDGDPAAHVGARGHRRAGAVDLHRADGTGPAAPLPAHRAPGATDLAELMIIAIDPDGPSSAVQIHDQITWLITTGALARGEQLPSVRQLAADLDVAPGTVAKAYRRLEADGLTVSRTGAGTRI